MTHSSSTHPSYLALDRAALGSSSAELRAHLESCGACRSYVESLAEVSPVSALPELRRRAERQERRLQLAWWTFAPLAAAACALLFFGLRPSDEPAPDVRYIGAKGFASVWIYVKRGPSTELWDGKRALAIGDQLRLKVDPGEYTRVEVYSLKRMDAPERLYAGTATPGVSSALPDAWELDAEPGAERLVVVLSHAAVTPSWPQWWNGEVTPGVSVLRFELPKLANADADAGDGGP